MTNTKFITHGFAKMLEVKGFTPLSAIAAKDALKQLDETFKEITALEGKEVAENTLSYKTVKRALERCLDYFENSQTSVTEEDHYIYYEYAYGKLLTADNYAESDEANLA